MPQVQIVKFMYFKPSGKYYSDGEWEVPADLPMHEIFFEARKKLNAGDRPGLTPGGTRFHCVVSAPGHIHDHPMLWVGDIT